jgi:plasmid stabilization system protein ParE
MKKGYEVRWASVAENDLLGVVIFIAEDSPVNAMKVLAKIKTKTAKLESAPMRGRVVPELQRQGISFYREIVIAPWRVIYKIEEDKVYVLSVVDSRRNVEDLLLARLLQ